MATQTHPKLTAKQRLSSMGRVAAMSYRIAPSVLYIRIVSAVLGSVLPIATTYFAAQTTTQLVRAYSGQAGAGQLAITYVFVTALFGVVTTAWASVERFVGQSARYKLTTVIQGRMIQQFLSLDYWRYDDKKTADLLDEARKFSDFFNYIFDTLSTIFTAIVGLIGSIIALLFVSWWLSLLLVIAVLPDAFIQYRLSKARTAHWKGTIDVRRKAYNIEYRLTQINHIAELRSYGLVKHLLDLRQLYRDKDGKVQVAIERSFIGKEFLASFIQAAAEVTALVYIALRIIAHAQPIGQFLYVQQMVSRGLGSMSQALSQFLSIDQDMVNLGAFDEFMSLPTQQMGQVALAEPPQQIELQAVSFHYPQTEQEVLRDISFTVAKGERIAIVGENGAGKSTLVKLLLGFYQPTKGKVLIDGVPTADLDLDSWHAQVGVLQQASGDYDFADARDNILYGDVLRPVSEKRYQQAITNAEAKDFLNKLPKKDRTYITPWMESEDGTPGVGLSGGQWQRLALARNFYRDSPVIILDEPTSAIDALAEARIFKRLFDEKGKTIITISHRLSTVRRADRIYVLENGQVVEQGTHAELIKKKGAYFTLFESQL